MAQGDDKKVLQLLQRLFVRQWRSLPLYLLESWLWSDPKDEAARSALKQIGARHTQHAMRLAELIQERGGAIPSSGYPDGFTDANYHFVGLDYVLGELVQYQRELIASIESDCNGFAGDPEVRSTIDAVLSDERENLDKLKELADRSGGEKDEDTSTQ